MPALLIEGIVLVFIKLQWSFEERFTWSGGEENQSFKH